MLTQYIPSPFKMVAEQEGVFCEPASAASVAGNVLGFITGFISGLRGRKAGDKTDEGEESGLRFLRRWLPF